MKEWRRLNIILAQRTRTNLCCTADGSYLPGTLVAGAEKRPNPQTGGFSHWFTSSFPTGTLPTRVKLCPVEFLFQIPWVLQEIPGPSTGGDGRDVKVSPSGGEE